VTAPAHTVIYTHGGGRLGNQVIRFAHWIAWARASGGEFEVLNVAFWPYAGNFALWREHPGCVFPVRPGRADRWARRRAGWPRLLGGWTEDNNRFLRVVQEAGRWWPGWQDISLDITKGESIDLEDPAFFARVAQSRVTTCCGWRIASWRLVAEQQAELRAFFQPAPAPARIAADFLAGLRARHDLVIGVFIRQSDYRQWHDGRFLFDTPRYAGWIRQLLDLHPGRRVAIVVASEVWQDPALFAGLPVHFATGSVNAGGHSFESWVELSLCDLVLSPPSTFSTTAAWISAVPLWPVTAADQELAPGQLLQDPLIDASRHPVFSRSVR
jgi:hypothetical protein